MSTDYTEGVMQDGAVFLADGQPMTITEVLIKLKESDNLLAYLQNMRNNIANSDPCDRKAEYEQGQSDFCNMMIRKLENGDFSDEQA